jgi:hypothetical protein
MRAALRSSVMMFSTKVFIRSRPFNPFDPYLRSVDLRIAPPVTTTATAARAGINKLNTDRTD